MLQRLVVASHQFDNQRLSLTIEQQHYLCRVLRLRDGDRFIAMDGQGHSWLAKLLTEAPSTQHQAEILEAISVKTELMVAITLVMALPKGNGLDDIVRQATELGVACVAPVISDRTLLNPSAQKVERWRRLAQEAAEQSERQIVPTILDPVPFVESLQIVSDSSNTQALCFICVTRQNAPHLMNRLISHEAATDGSPAPSIMLTIGPEGGWTDAEVEQAIAVGYQPVSLGPRILRTVTAPLVALSLISAFFESAVYAGMGNKESENARY
jgi:16S rRNA (uracil1498-N3)-methyltransferase